MAQVVEHILGKDEVGSSSLPNSSKKKDTIKNRVFLFVFAPAGHNIVCEFTRNIIYPTDNIIPL